MDKNNSSVRSVDRALAIVETLAKHGKGLGLVELANEVGLNKSTTYRMLCSIMAHGWISKDPSSGNYRLTLKMFELGSKVTSNVLTVTRPFFEELSYKIGETFHLVVQEDADVVYLYKEESSIESIKMGSRVGFRTSMFVTGVGKAILAFLDSKEVERLWNKTSDLPKTKNTIVSLDEMYRELEIVKERGWALDNEENEIGVRCVAVPILSRENYPVAAISISGSVFHITQDKYEDFAFILKDTARKIAIQLGI